MAITQDQVETTVADCCRIINELIKYASENSEKFTGASTSHEAEFIGNLQSEYSNIQGMVDSVESFRSSLASTVALGRSLLTPAILEMGKVLNVPETSAEGILGRLYLHMNDDGHRVLSRNFTFGTPTGATFNTGDGQILRLNTDENAYSMEAQTPETKRAICTNDVHSGAAKHEEVFELRGQDAERDGLKIIGSGSTGSLRALSARDSLRYISNASFSDYSGTTSVPTAISDWTVSTGSINDCEIETTNYYRDFEGDGTPAALKYTGSVKLTQAFTVRSATFDPGVPLYAQVAVYKPTSGTGGTVKFAVGGKEKSVGVNYLATNWNVLRLAGNSTTTAAQNGFDGGGNENNWFANYNESDMDISVEWSSASSGDYVLFDDIVMGSYTPWSGGWYAAVGGGNGATAGDMFLRDDEFSWSDTATDTAIIQKMLWRYFGAYLPSTTSTTAVTFPDPT